MQAANDNMAPRTNSSGKPTKAQRHWLTRGLAQPGGKLPLFDEVGRRVSPRIIRACLKRGWAEPWFNNPLKPDWLVCKLTDKGRELIAARAPRERRARTN